MTAAPLVLGVYFGHNASVALARGGEIVFALSEERVRRQKNYTGFPSRAYRHLREQCLAPGEEIDLVVFPSDSNLEYSFFLDSGQFADGHYFDYYHTSPVPEIPAGFRERDPQWIQQYVDTDVARVAAINADEALRARALDFYEQQLGVCRTKFRFINHHAAHAYSAGWHVDAARRWLVMTLDGSGDNLCATVGVLANGCLTELARTPRYASPGRFYREVTAFLGFRPDEHEYKVMGLAPYARPADVCRVSAKLEALFRVDHEGSFTSPFPLELTTYHLLESCAFERFDAIAGAAQALIEDRTAEWVRHWVERTSIGRVAVAGGVFMNVKLNQRLAELPEVAELSVVPSAGDESTVFGCCYAGVTSAGCEVRTVEDLTLGPDVRSEDVRGAVEPLAHSGLATVTRCDDVEDRVAALLAEGEIVARVEGRSEWGARALGNRSLLADPREVTTVRILNDVIKCRDFWMPFAPSILEEDASRYVEWTHRTPAPYMAVTFDATSLGRRHLAAAMHPQDFTLRPQFVRREWNPRYHRVIERFKARTGVGALLNTSLNLHGEPCVLTAADAVNLFQRSNLRHMAIADWLVSKVTAD